jgi:hypothetical protein
VAAAGFSFSVKGLYVKSASDVRNNVAYVSVGVDSDGDGYVDTEYIFYRNDTVDGPGWIAPCLLDHDDRLQVLPGHDGA